MSGDAFLVELRPCTTGSGFIVSARLRVLSWEQVGKDRLPVTMFGTASRASFIPTRGGMAAIESRDAHGNRTFINPLVPETPLREKSVRTLLRRCAEGAFDRGAPAAALSNARDEPSSRTVAWSFDARQVSDFVHSYAKEHRHANRT